MPGGDRSGSVVLCRVSDGSFLLRFVAEDFGFAENDIGVGRAFANQTLAILPEISLGVFRHRWERQPEIVAVFPDAEARFPKQFVLLMLP